MPIPDPVPGLVFHYGYLWRHEHDRGLENARYARPSAIVVTVHREGAGETEVAVCPLTHQQPDADQRSVEIPASVRRTLGLPHRTWVITNELNTFTWPGFDLARNDKGEVEWGHLPPALLARLRDDVYTALREGGLNQVPR